MKPMKPMKPMQPMGPMPEAEKWWPRHLGAASASGAQNGMRYAFFAEERQLLIERDGTLTTYDSGEHRIEGVSQAANQGPAIEFTSRSGPVRLEQLRKIS